MSKVAAVFSLGTSMGGCEYAIRKILEEEAELPDLFFFYGEPAAGQPDSPVDSLSQIRSLFGNVPIKGQRATNAFALEKCFETARELVAEIAAGQYARTYLGVVGGTNPMAATLFYAGMTGLPGEVIPIYVQGKPGPGGAPQSVGMLRWVRARDRLAVDRVLGRARQGHLSAAAVLAAELAEKGRAGFVREAVVALDAWDNFDYSAAERFEGLARRAEDYEDDGDLAGLRRTLTRYAAFAKGAADTERLFADIGRFREAAANPKGLATRVEQRGLWLAADALANATRRMAEHRYADSVLRAYRAVEVATQYRLFRAGVHPGELVWDREPLAAVRDRWEGPLPRVVSFELALKLVESLTGSDLSDTGEARKQVQSVRNQSYLEHGYQRITEKAAASTLRKAVQLSERIAGRELSGMLEELRMEF